MSEPLVGLLLNLFGCCPKAVVQRVALPGRVTGFDPSSGPGASLSLFVGNLHVDLVFA